MIEANRALASGAELRGTVRLRAAEPCAADLSASEQCQSLTASPSATHPLHS